MGILQARMLEWVAYPFPRRSPNPGIEPGSPALQADSLPTELPGKPQLQRWLKYTWVGGRWDSASIQQRSNGMGAPRPAPSPLPCPSLVLSVVACAHSPPEISLIPLRWLGDGGCDVAWTDRCSVPSRETWLCTLVGSTLACRPDRS